MPHIVEPTDQQLRETCARMAQRFGWSEAFDVVMQDPARSRMVRMAAKHPTAAGTPPARAPRACPAPSTPPRRSSLPLFDHKRAASGERDDD